MSTPRSTETSQASGEIDLFELVATLWAGRWIIVLVSGLFALCGAAYALLATEWYESKVVLVHVDTKSLPSGFAQLGGLASLAGINLAVESNEQTPLAVLKSKDLARDFITQEMLLPVFFAEKWDSEAKKWKSADPKKQPDLRDGVKYFDENVREVSEDKKTGLVTLSITWKDPAQSATWANLLVAQVNERLRQQALQEAEHNIEYLQNEMAATNIPSLQRAIGSVLESEMQKLLFARGRDEFAFKVIDKAVPPKERIRPRRTIIVAFALMLGGALSCVIVLFRRPRTTTTSPIGSRGQT
jgi:uncharacterized protein involved in exopolysaccharide biosynthesis